MSIFEIANENGKAFRMRIVRPGDAYGRNMELTNGTTHTLVEFYDAAHEHTVDPDGKPLGQFISRYRADTLLGTDSDGPKNIFEHYEGLNLEGGVDSWSLDASALADVELALWESGLTQALRAGKYTLGFMAFRAETPDRRIDPYPAAFPDVSQGRPTVTQGWCEVFGVYDHRKILENEIAEDAKEFEWGEDEMDNIFVVAMGPDGAFHVFHEEPRYRLASYTADQICEANGVTLPAAQQDALPVME